MPADDSTRALLAELHAHAARGGDAALQAKVQQLKAALSGASSRISVGNITGSTAVAIGSNIHVLVQQTNLPPDLLTRLLALADTLNQHAAERLDASRQRFRLPSRPYHQHRPRPDRDAHAHRQ